MQLRLANMEIELEHKKQAEKEAEEDAIREEMKREYEETQKLIQDVIARKHRERLERVDHMYEM